jgi:dTDP-4-dehydrorhamnose reductase
VAAAFKQMKWLIAGANGQLGRCLQQTLESNSIEYAAYSKEEIDINDDSRVCDVIHRVKPDIVVNAAAYTNVDQAEIDQSEAFAINQAGVVSLANASKMINARLIHFSTDYVFSGESTKPWQVSDATNPVSKYGESKLAGESEIARIYPENSIIVRTAWLYSPFGKNFYKTILNKAINGQDTVRVVNDQIGQPTNANELAELIVRAISKKALPGLYHGTNSGACSWFEFARFIFEIAGEDVNRVVPVPTSEFATRAKRPKYSVLDGQKWLESGIEPLGPWKDSVRNLLPAMTLSLAK